MNGWATLGISVVLLGVNGFFVALEFSLVGSRRTKLEELAAQGSWSARLALDASGDLTLQLAGAQLGITVASLGLGLVAEPAMAHLLEPVVGLAGLPVGVEPHHRRRWWAWASWCSSTWWWARWCPRTWPWPIPSAPCEGWCRSTGRTCSCSGRWSASSTPSATSGARAFGVQPHDELSSTPTAEELTVMLSASHDEGLIEDFAHELLTGVLDFEGRDAASIMVPRSRIRSITAATTVAEAEALVVDSGHSRLPVQGPGGIDDVRGFVHAKDLLLGASDAGRPVPRRLVRQMLVVPVDRTLEELLLAMRTARVHFALVTDPEGRTAGIVTLEDLLEELVGDILDESD